MTDKEKLAKVRAEVERLYNQSLADENRQADRGLEGAAKVSYGKSIVCKELLSFINSMQEEPTGNPLGSTHAEFRTAVESLGISQEEHDRIVDECIYGKEPELVDGGDLPKEEPVSNDFEMALAEMIDKAQTSVVEPLVIAAQWKDELIKLAKSEEPVSDDLEEAARNIRDRLYLEEGKRDEFGNPYFLQNTILKAVIMGAQWQKEQFEKNRLKHCNSITNEQAELEQGFIDQHLDKYQRMPTFLDAVEYGMNLQKEELMKDSTDAKIGFWDGELVFDYAQNQMHDYLNSKGLTGGDKVKVLIIKEG